MGGVCFTDHRTGPTYWWDCDPARWIIEAVSSSVSCVHVVNRTSNPIIGLHAPVKVQVRTSFGNYHTPVPPPSTSRHYLQLPDIWVFHSKPLFVFSHLPYLHWWVSKWKFHPAFNICVATNRTQKTSVKAAWKRTIRSISSNCCATRDAQSLLFYLYLIFKLTN